MKSHSNARSLFVKTGGTRQAALFGACLLAATLSPHAGAAKSTTTATTVAATTTTTSNVTPYVRPTYGALFNGSLEAKTDSLALSSPQIKGALYPIYWSEIEPVKGQYNWALIDARLTEWAAANKGIGIRIVWSSSGYWGNPKAKTPTPQWVLDEGAKIAFHPDSGTEVPLFWDPIYLMRAKEFLSAFAARYDGHPNLLFVDATPGAETNPYRLGTIDKNDPSFAAVFAATPASDGRVYSGALWWDTLMDYLNHADVAFKTSPVLITLNKAGLPGETTRLRNVGDEVAARKMWVGQNGLQGRAFKSSRNAEPWLTWGLTSQLYFEPVSAAGGTTGTLQELVDACQRVNCNWLNIYAKDVLKALPGSTTYEAASGAALTDLLSTVGN